MIYPQDQAHPLTTWHSHGSELSLCVILTEDETNHVALFFPCQTTRTGPGTTLKSYNNIQTSLGHSIPSN